MLRFKSGIMSLAAIAGIMWTSTVYADPESPDYTPENEIFFRWQNFTPYRYEVVRKYKSDCIYDEGWYLIVYRDNNTYPDIGKCLRNNKPVKLVYEVNSLEGPKWKARLEYRKESRDRAEINIDYEIEPMVNIDRLLAYCAGKPCIDENVVDKPHPHYRKVKIVKPLIKRTAMGIFYKASP